MSEEVCQKGPDRLSVGAAYDAGLPVILCDTVFYGGLVFVQERHEPAELLRGF